MQEWEEVPLGTTTRPCDSEFASKRKFVALFLFSC